MAATQAAGGTDYEDQTNIQWVDQNYPHALNRFTALHYFELSPFFDPACNNTVARQQGRDPAIVGALEFVAPAGGLEYVIELEQPPHLFVIRKQLRRGIDTSLPGASTPLAIYYILDKVIYQAPNLHAILSSRIRRCVWNLHKGFSTLQADLDPLVRLVDEHNQRAVKQQEQDAGGGEAGSAGVALPSSGVDADEADEAVPLAVGVRVTPEEAAYWKRTDNIILTVLSGYQVPTLPDVYYQSQAQQDAAAAAQLPPPLPAPKPEQEEQVQAALPGGDGAPGPGVGTTGAGEGGSQGPNKRSRR